MSDNIATMAPPEVLKAWEVYKNTDAFTNTKKWASSPNPDHLDGSLWAAWYAGYKTGGSSLELRLREYVRELKADGDYCNDEPWRQKMYREFVKRLEAELERKP